MGVLWTSLSKLFDGLVATFVFVRDIFGYLIPGLIFAGLLFDNLLGALPSLTDKWWPLAALLLGSYAAGHALAAIGYMAHDVAHYWISVWNKGRNQKLPTTQEQIDLEASALFARYRYAGIFDEHDRQDTIHITRIGVAVGLILASLLHLWKIKPAFDDGLHATWYVLLAVGAIILINTYGGGPHLRIMQRASIAAVKMATDAGVKPERGT